MITVYTHSNSRSCRNALNWFKEHDIHVVERKVNQRNSLTKSELFSLLKLSQNGFADLLVLRSSKHRSLLDEIDFYTVNQVVELIIKCPDLLKKPLITDGKKIYAGFNAEHIRCFIPEKKRVESLQQYYLSNKNMIM